MFILKTGLMIGDQPLAKHPRWIDSVIQVVMKIQHFMVTLT